MQRQTGRTPAHVRVARTGSGAEPRFRSAPAPGEAGADRRRGHSPTDAPTAPPAMQPGPGAKPQLREPAASATSRQTPPGLREAQQNLKQPATANSAKANASTASPTGGTPLMSPLNPGAWGEAPVVGRGG
ncbi:hypothetical protein J2Z30_009290 [Streptomyces iranensis]|uniref:Uncharacterized protein n=1 Tax=Streptomyces iranensis TaxID=576784 RepID=A0ABS4N9X9_9ACTN|nr:hypothetical protein [Streptomyces iranensis]